MVEIVENRTGGAEKAFLACGVSVGQKFRLNT